MITRAESEISQQSEIRGQNPMDIESMDTHSQHSSTIQRAMGGH